MNGIAQTFEVHYVTVSRIVKMKGDFWEMGDLTPLPHVFDYIESFYNRVRRQSRLGQLSPLAFEQLRTGS